MDEELEPIARSQLYRRMARRDIRKFLDRKIRYFRRIALSPDSVHNETAGMLVASYQDARETLFGEQLPD